MDQTAIAHTSQLMVPVFYYTVHPGDMMRTRIPQGVSVMLVASAFWDEPKRRFRIRRPPANHIGQLVIDSGGFTAAKRWGRYPWTPEQYVDWVREESRDVPLTFCASMDYACERDVNREALATNTERIRASIEHELTLRTIAPDLPWLGVLQGNTVEERMLDVRCRRRLGLLRPLMGIGSICGRSAREAAAVVRLYARAVPARFHAFGLDVRALDVRALDVGDDIALSLASWDSYAWNWARGRKQSREPGAYGRLTNESRSAYTSRLAALYDRSTIKPRQVKPRQHSLPLKNVS